VRATFFVQGRWVEAYPETARSYRDAGHLIGNHSFYHARMQYLTDDGLRTDIGDAHRVIDGTLGLDPRPWFRLPFGAGATDGRVLAALADLGYRHVGWDVSPEEWEIGRTAGEVASRLVEGVGARGDGAIVLLHTWPTPVRGLADIIERLRDIGAEFVRVDELSARDTAA
jgi:peptidoglycan/xylan/chitin deacetylase (PgdA/CDA1 family)